MYAHIVNVFPSGMMHRPAVTAMQQPPTSRSIFCVFFRSFASSSSRHLLDLPSFGGKYGFATAIICFEAPQPGYAMYIWYDHSAV